MQAYLYKGYLCTSNAACTKMLAYLYKSTLCASLYTYLYKGYKSIDPGGLLANLLGGSAGAAATPVNKNGLNFVSTLGAVL